MQQSELVGLIDVPASGGARGVRACATQLAQCDGQPHAEIMLLKVSFNTDAALTPGPVGGGTRRANDNHGSARVLPDV